MACLSNVDLPEPGLPVIHNSPLSFSFHFLYSGSSRSQLQVPAAASAINPLPSVTAEKGRMVEGESANHCQYKLVARTRVQYREDILVMLAM